MHGEKYVGSFAAPVRLEGGPFLGCLKVGEVNVGVFVGLGRDGDNTAGSRRLEFVEEQVCQQEVTCKRRMRTNV